MPQDIDPQTHLLLSIAFSHYNEKARWAFAYYGVPYTHHLLLPGLHVFSVKPFVDRQISAKSSSKQPQETRTKSSPYSTPCLVVYKDDHHSTEIQESFHESHDILQYLSTHFSTPERPNLYRSCGPEQEATVVALERRYDESLGVAARNYVYRDIRAVIDLDHEMYGGTARGGDQGLSCRV